MLYQMRVVGLAMDPFTHAPIVILRDKDAIEEAAEEGSETETTINLESDEHVLPIWIGEAEANAIAMELLGVSTARPMTHDLLKRIVLSMGGKVRRVVVNDLRENTFYAIIEIATEEGDPLQIDSRPSDALALALRCEADIFVEELVLEKARQNKEISQVAEQEAEELDEDKLKELLESMSADSVGKYKQ